MLKAPFKIEDGGNDWMWIEVTKWKGNSIEGILQSELNEISTLKAGARVQANQVNIFDYIIYKPDGSMEGNETGQILEKRN